MLFRLDFTLQNTRGLQKRENKLKLFKWIDTKNMGRVLINEDNELKVGSSAAYVKFDGIINFTSPNPEKEVPGSFAVTFKEKEINEERLKKLLGDKFQGKIIRGKMWIYNEKKPLKLNLNEIIEILKEL